MNILSIAGPTSLGRSTYQSVLVLLVLLLMALTGAVSTARANESSVIDDFSNSDADPQNWQKVTLTWDHKQGFIPKDYGKSFLQLNKCDPNYGPKFPYKDFHLRAEYDLTRRSRNFRILNNELENIPPVHILNCPHPFGKELDFDMKMHPIGPINSYTYGDIGADEVRLLLRVWIEATWGYGGMKCKYGNADNPNIIMLTTDRDGNRGMRGKMPDLNRPFIRMVSNSFPVEFSAEGQDDGLELITCDYISFFLFRHHGDVGVSIAAKLNPNPLRG